MAAEDDRGLGIPVPDEDTQPHEFYALMRSAINAIAALLPLDKESPTLPQLREASEKNTARLTEQATALETLRSELAEIGAVLTAAAGPEGNAAKLAGRLEAVEQQLQALAERPAPPNHEQQKLIDDLRLKVANMERKAR